MAVDRTTDVTGLTEVIERMRADMSLVQQELEGLQKGVQHAESSIESGAVLGTRLKVLIVLGTMLTTVFSAGAGYTMWQGALATDEEVKTVIERHDDSDKAHPKLKREIYETEGRLKSAEEMLRRLEQTQARLDKRSEYQFEVTRWQMRVIEARAARRKIPPKPERLNELERELLLAR